MAEGEQVG